MPGPSNLTDMLKFNASPEKSINKSTYGHIIFLPSLMLHQDMYGLIWLKSNNPPIKFINDFLKNHGITNTDPLKAFKITTTKYGHLPLSRAFKNTVIDNKIQVESIAKEEVENLLDVTPLDAYIIQ